MLISKEYAEINRRMHERPEYGVMGQTYAHIVSGLANQYRTASILDYGCGKRTLEKALGFPIWNCDPAIDGLDDTPAPRDIVACTDVLEHIEPECLDAVLDDMRRCTLRVMMSAITVVPAKKLLPDGTNPHKICEPWEWWHERLSKRWRLTNFLDMTKRFVWIGTPV